MSFILFLFLFLQIVSEEFEGSILCFISKHYVQEEI